MNFLPSYQFAKINRVLGDDHAVFCEAARKHDMIGLTQASHIARMDRVMFAASSEAMCKLGRKTFVDEQPQAALVQGRPPGLPMIGWVRA